MLEHVVLYIQSCYFNGGDFSFVKGCFYPIIEETLKTISISETGLGCLVFSNEIADELYEDYHEYFRKV